MIRKKRLSALLTALILSAFLSLQAQPDYWAMKESMNDKSLPLVNITVDINEVNSEYIMSAQVWPLQTCRSARMQIAWKSIIPAW